jgi:hypothetical protein
MDTGATGCVGGACGGDPVGVPTMRDVEFIQHLKTLDGAIPYDGDASCQVVFKLANGKTLRIGVTDDDVTDQPGLWADQYEGLNGELTCVR